MVYLPNSVDFFMLNVGTFMLLYIDPMGSGQPVGDSYCNLENPYQKEMTVPVEKTQLI